MSQEAILFRTNVTSSNKNVQHSRREISLYTASGN